jgi:hypothetical protein
MQYKRSDWMKHHGFAIRFLSLLVCLSVEARSGDLAGLDPVGHWPLNEGTGEVAHDRAGGDNHGRLRGARWQAELLDFPGVYQWGNIPWRAEYQGDAFSLGGWIYLRSPLSERRAGLLMLGNAHHTSGFTLDTLTEQRARGRSSDWRLAGGAEGGVGLYLRDAQRLEVISGGEADALGSGAEGIALSTGVWHHVLYTYEAGAPLKGGPIWRSMQERDQSRHAGMGRLYLDGAMVAERGDVPFSPRNESFLFANNAAWWQQHYPVESLDGSLRDLVIFDRALAAGEVARLVSSTRPSVQPVARKEIVPAEPPEREDGEWLAILNDAEMSEPEQARAVFALIRSGVAAAHADVLTEALAVTLAGDEAPRMPRVEDLLRNALIQALHPLASGHPEREALLARALPEKGEGRAYLSQNDPLRDARRGQAQKAYSKAAMDGDVQYRVRDIRPEETSEELIAKFPQVIEWWSNPSRWRVKPDSRLSRVLIEKLNEQEEVIESALLGGDWFFFGGDDKYRHWSLALDRDGYVHLTGGKHNWVGAIFYAPGVFERLGLSPHFEDDTFPTMMYWVSREPRRIDDFEFVGQRENPRNIPTPHGMEYRNFIQDNDGVLYAYGRVMVQGVAGWGMYRYDTETRTWAPLGGFVPDVKREWTDWADALVRYVADDLVLATMAMRHDTPRNRILVWSRQPAFYNYGRAHRLGIYFDRTNRLHVHVPIKGLDEHERAFDSLVYAWSDNGGKTFHRADGAAVALPLTTNPGPGNADVRLHGTEDWLESWLTVLHLAGYAKM